MSVKAAGLLATFAGAAVFLLVVCGPAAYHAWRRRRMMRRMAHLDRILDDVSVRLEQSRDGR